MKISGRTAMYFSVLSMIDKVLHINHNINDISKILIILKKYCLNITLNKI